MSNAFKRASLPVSNETRAMTLAPSVARKGIRPTTVQTRLILQPNLTLTPPSPTDVLWGLHDVLDMEIHVATADTAKKDEHPNKAHFATKPYSDSTPTDVLWDLHDVLDVEIHVATADTVK